MTVIHVPIQIGTLAGDRWLPVEDALVDTGASLPQVPAAVLTQLGIRPVRQLPFILADGREQLKDVGYALVRAEGREAPMPVVFAAAGEPTLLGAWALEVLFLGVDPVHERLVPIPGWLAAAAP